jgi:hypothetical protein
MLKNQPRPIVFEFENSHNFIKSEAKKTLDGKNMQSVDNSIRKFLTLCMKEKNIDVQEMIDFITSYAHGYFESGFFQGFLLKQQMIEDRECT